MITNWNNTTAKLVAADVETALRTVMAKHGLNPASVKKMKHAGIGGLDLTVSLTIKQENMSTATLANSEAVRILNQLNLPLGTVLRSTKFGPCTVYDYDFKKPTYPILARAADGRSIKFTTTSEVISRPAGFVMNNDVSTAKAMYGTVRRSRSRYGY